MKRLLGCLLGVCLSFCSYAVPNTTFPQQPSMLYYPHLHNNNEYDPSLPVPQNNIWTGNDKATTSFPKSGSMDTTPIDDTGTEKDINYKLQPDYKLFTPNRP